MRLVSLNDVELAFCQRVAEERERYAVGFHLERGWTIRFRGQIVEPGTAEGDDLMRQEVEVHRQGVTGELAFCKHFDVYYANNMLRVRYHADVDDFEWEGDTKDADVEHDIEIRTIAANSGSVQVKAKDNLNFNVVGIRRLTDDSSLLRILGYFPVSEAIQHRDWIAKPPYTGFQVPVEALRPIELLPFRGRTLAEYECEQRNSSIWSAKSSPYMASLYAHHALELTDDVEFLPSDCKTK